MKYQPVIGLEVHAEMETASKMFCACPRVDSTTAAPNSAVCPVCAGMPGVLPVVNGRAVEFALRVALALECEIAHSSLFVRKNYFYPDLPKGYQISQYEQPLAQRGRLEVLTSQGTQVVHIRRVHLEEDTGKLTHVNQDGDGYSLVDLNRAGVPLLEIVTEPDLHTPEEARAYAAALRSLLRYLEVNSGDMQKGVLRIEPNISLRPEGSQALGVRTEIKNLNSLRALERSVAFEIKRQGELLDQGLPVLQETRGWDEAQQATLPQRSKEEAEDYRYFPEPDLPPLVIEAGWLEQIRAALPETPAARFKRFMRQYELGAYEAGVLTAERAAADYFEQALAAAASMPAKNIANWVSGELFALLNQAGLGIEASPVPPAALAELAQIAAAGEINQNTAKSVLGEMFASGRAAAKIVDAGGLRQVSDPQVLAGYVRQALAENPEQVSAYLRGKTSLARWLFGQAVRKAGGRANPQALQAALDQALQELHPE